MVNSIISIITTENNTENYAKINVAKKEIPLKTLFHIQNQHTGNGL